MRVLMCKDRAIFDIDSSTVLMHELLPGLMQVSTSRQNFGAWCQGRYSLKTNVIARIQRATNYPYNKPDEIDSLTGAFSLSDCYWIKTEEDQIFDNISPYFQKNWKNDKPVANIYTNGWQTKEWRSPCQLYKRASKNEIEIMQLAKLVGLTSITVVEDSIDNGILISNFTNTEIMFEPADMSYKFYEDVYEGTPLPRPERVTEVLGKFGELMLVFDWIVGNNDRHLGNFGFLRCANSGVILKHAPLFDFDQSTNCEIPRFALMFISEYCRYKDDIISMCKIIKGGAQNRIYIQNCEQILSKLKMNVMRLFT